MGFPTPMFTVLFALGPAARAGSPVARDDQRPGTKIGRPRQLYVGPTERDYPAR
jgi:citrate synthase